MLDRLHAQDDGEFASDYVKNVQLLVKGWAAGELSLEKYNAEFALLRPQPPGHQAYLTDVIDLERERAKYALDISKQTQALIEKADAAEYENAKIGATEQQLIALTAAGYDEQIALKEEKIAAIEMMEGRTVEQKKKLVQEITRITVEVLGGSPESVDILITDSSAAEEILTLSS